MSSSRRNETVTECNTKCTLDDLAEDLATGRTTSCALLEQCWERIDDPNGEGAHVYLKEYRNSAKKTADAIDLARSSGKTVAKYAGIPISIKDLFDVENEPTTAGSMALASQPKATQDADIVCRLKLAGFVILGKTNMTEFAYSGLGVNPHYGTPLNPYSRADKLIPGGSTSGGAVSVTDGMAWGTIGSDTGGSCRIPAALCGIVGFKTTASRISTNGAFPLSFTQDSIGPLANTTSCCAILDAVIANDEILPLVPKPVKGLRLAIPEQYVLEDLDDMVSEAFADSISTLSQANAKIQHIDLNQLTRLPEINRLGGFVGAEAYAIHRHLLESQGDKYDPWIRSRLEAGREQTAADYIDLVQQRRALIAETKAITNQFDALVMPTVPITALPLATIQQDADQALITNKLVLRNTSIANFLDRCAISLPCHPTDSAPVGFMLMGSTNGDRELLSIAKGIENIIKQPTH